MKKKEIQINLATDQDRPIAMIVQVASQYESKIHIEKDNKFINAKSIMGMMTVAIVSGEKISVVADGPDENEAIESIEKYLAGEN